MKCISSSYFCRFIGIPTVIKISDRGVVIDVENRLFTLQWEELIVPPLFHLSFFGQILTFKTANRNYVFTMLSYNAKRKHKNTCERLWALANIKRVDTLLTTIDKITTNRYLRQSTIERIQLAVNQEGKRWFLWLKLNRLNKLSKVSKSGKASQSSDTWASVAKKLQRLSYYQRVKIQDITDCRERYITKALLAHKAFFDHVESNPLTLHQRRACIIDNDNNLLLAGAGTGKTSVMVGRAGYLLNSGQAKHEQILLLAYGRKAANEMDERIQDKLSTTNISATTFHGLGLSIIAKVEGKKPTLSVLAEDEKAKSIWVQRYFEQLMNESIQYRELVLEYFSQYYYVERSVFDFTSQGDCYQYFTDNDIRTFKGEQVNSFGEFYIANALFTHGIEYQYRAKYAFEVQTSERKQYQPDFFLPELAIYIEYDEIDKHGDTAPYLDTDAYLEGIKTKRAIHHTCHTHCLELTYAQHQEGQLVSTLISSLNARHKQLGVLSAERLSPQLLPTEVILATLNENGRTIALAKTLSQLVGLYKAASVNHSVDGNVDITFKEKVIANAVEPKQTAKALALLKPISTAYEQHLIGRGEIDFDDMINKALAYVQTGKFQSPWRYIMVDEFQDISEPRARLVKALRDNNKDCSVFAVGDDWQAIYRFSGADFTLTTKFSHYFGATTQSVLDLTFRFNNHIGKVAADFISKNPAQIKKTINSLKHVNAPAVSLLKRDSGEVNSPNTTLIDEMANGAIDEVLAAISAKVCKPVKVYLLARFWFLLPSKQDLKRMSHQYPLLTIEPQSFHASKGKEADYVIIVGMKKGAHGFPSQKVTPPLLDALLAKKESFDYAEERRLFYVALTRAKDRVYIIADMSESNHFVKELVNEHQIELNEFTSSVSQSFVDKISCLVCETGILKKRTGRFGAFYACSHLPRCEHIQKPCAKCESPMTSKHYPGFKVCLNAACNSLIPTCGRCNADMVLRSSNKGEFWGCQNYKGNEPMSCKNSVEPSTIHWPKMA
ncbi:MAG TPA: AAA family ATPase, partial [Colwellia sp.]|nr:AAA family ATPase [Colwellia sp.]